jgi:hypothetical protein
MADYAKRAFDSLARLSVDLSCVEDKLAGKNLVAKGKGHIESKVQTAEGLGTNLDRDFQAAGFVDEELQELTKGLGRTIGYWPFLPATVLADARRVAARGGEELRGRLAVAELGRRMPDVMRQLWGERHQQHQGGSAPSGDIQQVLRAVATACGVHHSSWGDASGTGGGSAWSGVGMKRPRWDGQPQQLGPPGPRHRSIDYLGKKILLCANWLSNPSQVPCSRPGGCRYFPCGGHTFWAPAVHRDSAGGGQAGGAQPARVRQYDEALSTA